MIIKDLFDVIYFFLTKNKNITLDYFEIFYWNKNSTQLFFGIHFIWFWNIFTNGFWESLLLLHISNNDALIILWL